MEHLWSPGLQPGGNQRQIDATVKPKTSQTGCHRLPPVAFDGIGHEYVPVAPWVDAGGISSARVQRLAVAIPLPRAERVA
jgi:hypothetical protein